MADYRAMFDRDYIGSWDLPGDVVVTISEVKAGEVVGNGGRKAKKPIVRFEGKEKALLCNKTNAKTIAALYGNDTANWVGKRITLYPTKTQMGGEEVDAIRVRPAAPKGRAATPNGRAAAQSSPPQDPPGPGLLEHDAREPD